MCPTSVRVISTPEDLANVYRFRYEVYVAEMGRNPKHADHEKRELKHPLDATGVNLAAYDGSSVVGVIRNNIGPDGSFGHFFDFYGIGAAEHDHPARTSITSGLMVEATRRRGIIGARLATAAYEHGLSRGTRWNFIDCIPDLVPFFVGFGWIEHLPEDNHPEYPFKVRRLRLDLEDECHLERVRSPFLECLRKHKEARKRTRGASVVQNIPVHPPEKPEIHP